MMRQVVKDEVFSNGILTNADGEIIHNALQMDDPIRRRVYDDGTIVTHGTRSGRLLVPPYRVNDERGAPIPVNDWSEEG